MKLKKLILSATAFILLCGASFAQDGPAYPYSTNLSFTASTGTVTGYNMYRAPYTSGACGTFAKLNATPFTGLTYSDVNPPQGFYCYVATAVSTQGESGYSNIDSNIAIPAPPPTGLGATVASVNGVNETTFAWANPETKGLTGNKIHCKSGKTKFGVIVNTSAPVDELRLVQPAGYYTCGVTVISSGNVESGISNEVGYTVE